MKHFLFALKTILLLLFFICCIGILGYFSIVVLNQVVLSLGIV